MKRLILAATLFLGFASGAMADTWLNASNGQTGASPVWVGQENHKDVYVCRAGGLIPGKLIKADGKCYIPYFGHEYAYTNYQVLQASGRMRFFSSDSLSDEYLVLGGTENGINLHICRVRLAAGYLAGKLVGSVHGGLCYYGWYGREYSSTLFDALSDV